MTSPGTLLFAGLLLCALQRAPVSWSIMVPDWWREEFEMDAAQEENGSRGLIIEEILKQRDDREEFLRTLPCIRNFLKTYITEPQRSSILASADLEYVSKALFNHPDARIVYYGLAGEMDPEGRQKRASSTIIVIENSDSLLNMTNRMLDTCGKNCVFLVILVDDYPQEEAFLAEADRVVDAMWSHWVANLAILGRVDDTAFVSRSLSYKPDEPCAPSPASIVNRCEKDVWASPRDLKPLSMNGCVVHLAYLETHPYTSEDNETGKLHGIEGLMVEEIMEKMNVKLYREEVEWPENVSHVDQIETWLHYEEKIDILIGGMLWNPRSKVDYTSTYEAVKVVWMVPAAPNVSLRGLVTPFNGQVWLAIGVVLLVGGVVKLFLIRDISFLDILALIIGFSVSRQPRRTSTRIMFIFWALFGFFLTQFYLGALADQLMNASDLQIDTMAELSLSNLKLGGTERLKGLLYHSVDELEDSQRTVIELIRERFVSMEHNDYLEELSELISGRNTEYALMVVLNVSGSQPVHSKRAHIMKEILGTYPIALATWRGLPYLDPINWRIQYLIESGIIGLWARLIAGKDQFLEFAENAKQTDLRIEQFAPAFLLMIIGFSLGFFFLLLEILAYPACFYRIDDY